MSGHDPQPGELWETDLLPAAEKREDGWYRTDGVRSNAQWHTPIRLVGYTAEYVEKLRAERDADAAARDNAQEYGETVERRKDAWDLMWRNRVRNLQAQRDEAEAEVEKLRAELELKKAEAKAAHDNWMRAAERKPWEVLREAESITHKYAVLPVTARCEMLTLARELEAKAAEDSRREQLIEKAALAVGHIDGWTRGVQPETVARALDEAGLLKDADDE